MASARVGSIIISCQFLTGSWLVTMVDFSPWRSFTAKLSPMLGAQKWQACACHFEFLDVIPLW